MNQEKEIIKEENASKEVIPKFTFRNALNFGFGFGIGFFISNLIISIIIGFIVFTLFGAAISSFQRTITDPLGLKGPSYSQPASANILKDSADKIDLNKIDPGTLEAVKRMLNK